MLAVCTTIFLMLASAAQEEPAAVQKAPDVAQETYDYQIPPANYNAPSTLVGELRSLAAAHDHMKLVELGRSPAGEPLLMAVFAGPQFAYSTAPGTPAILVVANLEGDRLAASEVAMGLCRHLAEGKAQILRHAQVFVMPVANPDAAAHAFDGQLPWRGAPTDNDRDGRLDEDGPCDLDDDGRLLWMRVPSPDGLWLADELDSRSSRKADAAAGETGVFAFSREGLDADGDRERLEDGAGGVVVDANFPHRWVQYAPEAGRFQLSEPESRALVDFVLMHPSIAVAVILDDEDNLAKAPAGIKRSDSQSTEPLKEDAALLKILGERIYQAEEIQAPRSAEHGHGNFADWLYFQRGILVLESSLWSPPLDVASIPSDQQENPSQPEDDESRENAKKKKGSDREELQLLSWQDVWYDGKAFAPWTPLQHSQLGSIEVGGWLPLVLENPPAELLPDLTTNFTTFFDTLGADLPQLRWSVEVTALDQSGVFEARAFLVCDGLLPTMTAMGQRTRKQMPLRIRLELPSGGELLVGRPITLVERLNGLGDSHEFHWIYRLPANHDPARIRATSTTSGEVLMNLEVK